MRISITIVLLLCMMVTLGQSQSERSLIRDGNRQYKDNKYSDAEVSYRKALEKNREIHEGAFNLGDALYRQGRFGDAAEQYQSAATRAEDRSDKAQALHNLGNALLKAQKIPESIASYKDALKLNPNDADTKYNLEYAKMLLKQQQQQNKDQKNQQKQDKKDQQNQDQKSQDQQKKDQQQDQQKQDQQEKDKQKQQQAEQKDQQQQQAQKKQQISKQDAERILEALKNEEKDVQKKLRRKVPARARVEKDW